MVAHEPVWQLGGSSDFVCIHYVSAVSCALLGRELY